MINATEQSSALSAQPSNEDRQQQETLLSPNPLLVGPNSLRRRSDSQSTLSSDTEHLVPDVNRRSSQLAYGASHPSTVYSVQGPGTNLPGLQKGVWGSSATLVSGDAQLLGSLQKVDTAGARIGAHEDVLVDFGPVLKEDWRSMPDPRAIRVRYMMMVSPLHPLTRATVGTLPSVLGLPESTGAAFGTSS